MKTLKLLTLWLVMVAPAAIISEVYNLSDVAALLLGFVFGQVATTVCTYLYFKTG